MIPEHRMITGTGVPVRGDSIACDQIRPPEDATGESSAGLFAGLEDGAECVRDDRFRDATVLVVDGTFGSGGSRPGVAGALADWGVQAILATSFGEGLLADCWVNDIATATASERDVRAVQEWVAANPDGTLRIDTEDELLVYGVRSHDRRAGEVYRPGFGTEEFVPVSVA